MPHVRSWYAATANPAPERPPLAGAIDCDVCIVGGGIAGCSAALHLAQRGYDVALLEEQRIGWGASGRSGGQALVGVAAGQEKLERLIGPADARRVWDITVEGVELLKALIERHGIHCDWRGGHLQVALKPRQEFDLREETQTLQERYDYRSVRYVEREELRSLVASERYIGGLYDAGGGHLHPLNYTLGLAAAAGQSGAQIFEGTRALSWSRAAAGAPAGGAPLRVRTHSGEVRCRHLLLAGNAWLGPFASALRRKIMGVATWIVASEPLGSERARALIPNDAAVSDVNWVLDYFRRSADQRLLFGGRVSYSGLGAADAGRGTRQRMLAVFPQLADARIDYAWGGFVDITLNRAPHFGRLAPDVWFLQGFSGHGIVLTGIAGKLVAEAIAGTAERFDVFARIPHRDFPGGMALRRPALALAMLYYRLRDLL